MSTTRKLSLGLAALLIVGFGVLLWMGGEIHRQAPPMPQAVVSDKGDTWFVFRLWLPARREPVTVGPTAPAAR